MVQQPDSPEWTCNCGRKHTFGPVLRYVHPSEVLIHKCKCGTVVEIANGRVVMPDVETT